MQRAVKGDGKSNNSGGSSPKKNDPTAGHLQTEKKLSTMIRNGGKEAEKSRKSKPTFPM